MKATYLSSGDSFHGSGSVMGGGGLDFHLSGPWFARGQIDIQEDWTAHTTVGRVLVGGADKSAMFVAENNSHVKR